MTYSDRIHILDEPVPRAQAVRALSTAVKTLKLVDYLGSCQHSMRLSAIAAELSASRSTIYQRLVTLIEAGWVEQTGDGSFQLTMRPVRIASAALEQAGLGERTLPVLRELVAEVGETASLATMQNVEPCIIQRVEAGGVLQARAQLGTSMALSTSASGRVLIAFARPEEIEALRIAGARFPEETVLREVRRLGVGVAAGTLGVGAVAAPVFDHRQRCIAALSLVGPEARFDAKRMSGPVLAAANRLSVLLEGQPWGPARAPNGQDEAES